MPDKPYKLSQKHHSIDMKNYPTKQRTLKRSQNTRSITRTKFDFQKKRFWRSINTTLISNWKKKMQKANISLKSKTTMNFLLNNSSRNTITHQTTSRSKIQNEFNSSSTFLEFVLVISLIADLLFQIVQINSSKSLIR